MFSYFLDTFSTVKGLVLLEFILKMRSKKQRSCNVSSYISTNKYLHTVI